MSRTLAVKLTCGADDPERANQALTVASAAHVAGTPVSLWLTGEGVWFAVAGRVPDLGLTHATPAADLMAGLALPSASRQARRPNGDRPEGAEVTVCTQCAARRGLTEPDLVDGAQIRGAASFVELVLGDDVRALVY